MLGSRDDMNDIATAFEKVHGARHSLADHHVEAH
jgi:hypothetical protein